MAGPAPRLLVLSSLFPSKTTPNSGLFIRERMFWVGRHLPLVVVSPRPWSPFDFIIRRFRVGFRPPTPRHEIQSGFHVYYPRFLSVPGIFKSWDGWLMALGAWHTVRRLQREGGFDVIDAHFAFPDGHAARFLGRWFRTPFVVTLRGKEIFQTQQAPYQKALQSVFDDAAQVLAVSKDLLNIALRAGVTPERTQMIGNGVNLDLFSPEDRQDARLRLNLPEDSEVLVSVGWLVEGKGFHRVIDCLPALVKKHPKLIFMAVGGRSNFGDMAEALQAQVQSLGLQNHVRFLGELPPTELKWPLSAANLFVLATRSEGWANVFLEAMACKLPVVTTQVGGNPEVVCRESLGTLVPFGDQHALTEAIDQALQREWDREEIRRYAEENAWDQRMAQLVAVFNTAASPAPPRPGLR